MLRRRLNSGELRRRVLLAFLLSAGSFFLAHAVNGVVAYSLVDAGDRAVSMHEVLEPELGFTASNEYRQELVRSILSSGLFPLPPPPKDFASSAAAAVPPLNLPAKVSLLGIVRGGNDNERAIIEEVSSKKQGLYRVSQRIPDVGELVAIEKDRVLFREGAQEEWLELEITKQRAIAMPLLQPTPLMADGRSIPSMSQNRRTIDRAQLKQLVSNPQAYLAEARFQPHFNGSGQPNGVRVDGIRQVGVLEKTGLQNNDVLAGINGVEVRDPGKLWDMFKQLQPERTVRFNVVRQSQPVTLVVEIRG